MTVTITAAHWAAGAAAGRWMPGETCPLAQALREHWPRATVSRIGCWPHGLMQRTGGAARYCPLPAAARALVAAFDEDRVPELPVSFDISATRR